MSASESDSLHEQQSSGATEEELEQLRQLLLGQDYRQALEQMVSRSDTERVADTISEAIIQRNQRDATVAQALAPLIDDAINQVIRTRPQRITSVIYPIIGPSIRKSVSRALAEMVQKLNQVLESSLSLKAWGWRFNAWRAGVSYGEYVLLQTIAYRVEQVLLIHRHTGILLHAEHASGTRMEDPELVSSMLSAINDFVSDSFSPDSSADLENVRVGDLQLEIESGPQAILAAAVRGTPDEKVRDTLRQTLERLHRIYGRELDEFEGDNLAFENTADQLQGCLIQQDRTPARKRAPWLAIIALLLAGSWLGYTAVLSYEDSNRLDQIRQALNNAPGYLLIGEEKTPGDIRFRLLRSPGSESPEDLISGYLRPRDITISFNDQTAPLSLSDYTLPYLKQLFGLPDSVSLSSRNQTLILAGNLSEAAFNELSDSAFIKSAFREINHDALTLLPGPDKYDQALEEWQQLKSSIDSLRLQFQPNEAILLPGEEQKLPDIAARISRLGVLADTLGISHWQVYIGGYANSAGTDRANLTISRERADSVRNLLILNGVHEDDLLAFGAGYLPTSRLPGHQQRMVSFQVIHSTRLEQDAQIP